MWFESVASHIRWLRKFRPKLKTKSPKPFNQVIRMQKRAKINNGIRLERVRQEKYSDLIKFSEIKRAENAVRFNTNVIAKYKEAKRALKRKRKPSKKPYFGRGC